MFIALVAMFLALLVGSFVQRATVDVFGPLADCEVETTVRIRVTT